LTVGEITTLTGAQCLPGTALDRIISNVAALETASPRDLAFLDNAKYVKHLANTRAGACLIEPRFGECAPPHVAVLAIKEPYRAFVGIARALFPGSLRPSSFFDGGSVADDAHVHGTARLETDVIVDPGAVIGPGAEIGTGTSIAANAAIGPGVRIGRHCSIGAHCSIIHALIGDRVIIHPGCHIGQDGFGYAMGKASHVKVPQLGRVIIQDDVEVGAGTTIDRGAVRDTVVGEGTKIDNLVQIGHNVAIGRHCILVAQVGISGSATLEDYVVLGARVGVNNHVTIGEGARVAATAIVHGDIPAGARYGGWPAKSARLWMREIFTLERLARGSRDEPGGGRGRKPG
jgi:UDP-3-O-[3-hydroxymyristoyl] glucosamine N-acyltransferase